MRHPWLRLGGVAATVAAVALVSTTGTAHKPITSPFTFNEDVLPIVTERCAACHQPGGVAPMSLLTHAEAVPWGESMRAELMAGHMPPWRIDSGADRFRNVRPLTGRELNVLLTWASGGTPAGDPAHRPETIASERKWPLGPPDLLLLMPSEVTLAPEAQEHVAEFVVRPDASAARYVRAVDLQPATPAIVRSATVSVRPPSTTAGGPWTERLIGLWLPGDHPVTADAGSGFELPTGSDLIVRIRYRKTWEYENRAVRDRSSLGLYFADEPAAAIQHIALDANPKADGSLTSTTLTDAVRALAVYPDPAGGAAALTVTAVRPDGARETLIAFRPRPGWARRYWFREPIVLPRGTRLEMEARADEPLLPPGALPPRDMADSGAVRVVVNVVPED